MIQKIGAGLTLSEIAQNTHEIAREIARLFSNNVYALLISS